MIFCSDFGRWLTLSRLIVNHNPTTTPRAPVALPLLKVPALLTFTKFVRLPRLGERSHQLLAVVYKINPMFCNLLFLQLVIF